MWIARNKNGKDDFFFYLVKNFKICSKEKAELLSRERISFLIFFGENESLLH